MHRGSGPSGPGATIGGRRPLALATAVAAAAMLLGAACTSSSSQDAAPGTTVASVEEIVSGQPTPGSVTDILVVFAGEGAAADGRVTVEDVHHVTWFEDRPGRAAGGTTLAELVERWPDLGFDDVPPNAALVTDSGDAVVVLTDPQLTPTGGISFAYDVTKVEGALAEGPLGRVSVFVDDASVAGAGAGGVQCSTGFMGETLSLNFDPATLEGSPTCEQLLEELGTTPRIPAHDLTPEQAAMCGDVQGGAFTSDYALILHGVCWHLSQFYLPFSDMLMRHYRGFQNGAYSGLFAAKW